jgi:hypothetical protein
MRPGIADMATTNPAKAGESVRSKINQGMVITTIEFAKPEVKLENCNRKILKLNINSRV